MDVEIRGIARDFRQVQLGGIFVAIKGLNVGGHDYIPEATACGAVAVVVERELRGLKGNFPPLIFA